MRIARIAALAALSVLPTLAHAQTANVSATATVVTPLAVTGSAPLAFGNVFQGVNKTVAATDAASGRLSITGFGTFSVGKRNARVGRNPQTGEKVKIAASKAPKFKAGASLKAFINGKAAAPKKAAKKVVKKAVKKVVKKAAKKAAKKK
jgi:DNA-binding protein HU-beta